MWYIRSIVKVNGLEHIHFRQSVSIASIQEKSDVFHLHVKKEWGTLRKHASLTLEIYLLESHFAFVDFSNCAWL